MIGKTVSHYKILEELGRGGMGVVYKAQDTKLQRTVALKFLSAQSVGVGEEKERFVHEARSAAALNHSNICTIHEIGESEGQSFIAMEYVEGESLKSVIEKGPLGIERVIDIARQAATGLQEAHEKGIVHRDIKPSNIMITPKGQVKIMDFGLAKSAGRTQLTKEGTTLGTVSYMSPEQARGAEVDHRSDIWSVGVLLYEMLAGVKPFKGDYEQAVLYAILNEEPEPVGRLRTDVPTGLEVIVSRALDKNRNARYQAAADVERDLDKLLLSRAGASPRQSAASKKNMALFIIVAAVFIAAAILITLFVSQRGGQAPLPVSRQVTYTGTAPECAISPDGNYIAYRNSSSPLKNELWIKDLSSESSIELYSSMRCWNIKWSPDGSSLLFNTLNEVSEGAVCLIQRFGGAVRQLTDSPWVYTSWMPDGKRIAFSNYEDRTIQLLDIESGAIDTIFKGGMDTHIQYPELSPSGRLILFQTEDDKHQKLWIAAIEGGSPALLHQEEHGLSPFMMQPKWSPDGRAVYYLDGKMRGRLVFDLMKIPVDAETGKASGSPVCVMAGLHAAAIRGINSAYSISGDGTRLLYAHENKHSNLWLATVEGEEGEYSVRKEQLTRGTTWKSAASISPEEDRIAFAMGDANAMNIYTMAIGGERGEPEQITFFESFSDFPVWSPNGREIAFLSNQGGVFRVWRVGAKGGAPEPFEESSASLSGDDLAWAPGPNILYRSRSTELNNFMLLDPLSGSERPLLLDPQPGYVFEPVWAPDGKRIALFYNILEGNRQTMRAWVISLDDGSMSMLCDEVAYPISWSDDGRWIYIGKFDFGQSGKWATVFRVPSTGGDPEKYIQLPFDEGIDGGRITMTPDGRKLVYSKVETQTDIWIVEHFDPEVD